MHPSNDPALLIHLLNRAATSAREQRFVALAVRAYFFRVMNASMRKLQAHGLRPVVAPVAAELAVTRARHARTFGEFLVRLIDDDTEVATLVWRAIALYADRCIGMAPETAAQELRASADTDLVNAARIVKRNLTFIYPAAAGHQ